MKKEDAQAYLFFSALVSGGTLFTVWRFYGFLLGAGASFFCFAVMMFVCGAIEARIVANREKKAEK